MFERLASRQPANDFAKIGLSRTLERFGDLLLQMDRAEEARERFRLGLLQAQSLLMTNHENTQVTQAVLRLRVKLGLDSTEIVIRGVAAGRPGQQLGLQAGDVICKYAGEQVANAEQWKWVSGRTNATPAELEIRRDGALLKFNTKAEALGLQCEDRSTSRAETN